MSRTLFTLPGMVSGYPRRQCRQGQALGGRTTRAALTAPALRIKRYPCSVRQPFDHHNGGRLCYLFPGQRQLEKVRFFDEAIRPAKIVDVEQYSSRRNAKRGYSGYCDDILGEVFHELAVQ
jgi:hypothetical protein